MVRTGKCGDGTTDTVSSNASVRGRESPVSGAPPARERLARSPATLLAEEEDARLSAAPSSEGEQALAPGAEGRQQARLPAAPPSEGEEALAAGAPLAEGRQARVPVTLLVEDEQARLPA